MAGAEGDGEGGEREGDVEGAVPPPGGDGRGGRAGQDLVAGGDRLQLERDVGDDADDGDEGDEGGEERALAVAAGDEVGDRGDAVGLGDADHLAHDDPGHEHRQRRAEVDRQEPDPAGRRPPDAAEVGPGGAVDPPGQRVEGGVVDDRAPLGRAPVAPGGDGEEEEQVAEGGAQHQAPGSSSPVVPGSPASPSRAPPSLTRASASDEAGPDRRRARRAGAAGRRPWRAGPRSMSSGKFKSARPAAQSATSTCGRGLRPRRVPPHSASSR